MRIMFYINCLEGGGAQRVMANLSNMFVRDGDEVLLVTSFPGEQEYELDSRVIRKNLSNDGSGNMVHNNLRYIFLLRKLLVKEKPDVLISFMAKPNCRAVIAAVGLPVRSIISVRNDPVIEYRGKLRKFFAQHVFPIADGCVFQTEDAKTWFPEKLQKKSAVIPNAVKHAFFDVVPDPIPGTVITCGRLAKQKNHMLLVNAFAPLTSEFPQARLMIYGKGVMENTVREYIETRDLGDRILLMGKTSDVPGVLSKAGCFVLSSDFEGMPNALMEAMAAGVPCISTDCPCGGPRMLLEDGISGLLVPIKDQQALTDAMRKILSDSEYAQRLGAEGRKAAESFEPEAIFRKWKAYITSVIT